MLQICYNINVGETTPPSPILIVKQADLPQPPKVPPLL